MAKAQSKLSEYRRKREPADTNEPVGTVPAGRRGETRSGRYVVHLHDATRLHYDLRLEVGGALESFAVPRGPSLDPKERRLSVRTEPHPLEYLEFEAIIPAGNYGAGPMIEWDAGSVRYLEGAAEDGLARGKLDFELAGFKLRGRFALVRLEHASRTGARRGDGKEWLLLKKQDAHARGAPPITEERPESILSGLTVEELERRGDIEQENVRSAEASGAPVGDWDVARMTPMLCAVRELSLREPGYLYELKLDGVRVIADKRGANVALYSRSGRAVTLQYPEVARSVASLPAVRAVLDGEVVTFDARGRPSFARLASRIHARRPADIRAALEAAPCVFVTFDLLALGDRDLRGLPLERRKELLGSVVRGEGLVRALDAVAGDGTHLFEFCKEHDLEGLVAKRGGAPYRPGPRRYDDWVKIVREQEDDFVVVGWTRGAKGRDRLGALDLASYEGDRLIVRGKVGTGFDAETISSLVARLKGARSPAPRAEGALEPAPRGRTFVEPDLVVKVAHRGYTPDGRLRFPVFRGVRDDLDPRDCRALPPREPAPPPAGLDAQAGETAPDARTGETAPDARTGETSPGQASSRRGLVTRPDKVFFPEDGFTKGHVCDYYAEISEAILPYLRDRPVVLVRYPDGIHGKSFYQWNVPAHVPSWVPTVRLEHEGKMIAAFLVRDRDSLLYVANLGAIPIHVLAAREGQLEQCDFATFDFDVERATLRDGVVLARTLHAILSELGLEGLPKTSGQSGLHVLVPLGPGVSFASARTFADLVGRLLEVRHSDIGTTERRIERRGARVYIDTGQTGRSRTIVAPYSVRAQQGATVSTPLSWDEVGPSLDPRRFNIVSVPDRVRQVGDPMRGLLVARPNLHDALSALDKLLRPKT